MNLDEWRARQQEGEAWTLPSGLDVRLKKVALLDLVHGGKIPDTLKAPVAEMVKRKADAAVELADLQKFGAVLDLVAGACILEPQGLTAAELPTADKQAIFNWANSAAARLEPFRRGQGADVESAFAVGDVLPEAKPDRRGH
jgi:hypothetical protein